MYPKQDFPYEPKYVTATTHYTSMRQHVLRRPPGIPVYDGGKLYLPGQLDPIPPHNLVDLIGEEEAAKYFKSQPTQANDGNQVLSTEILNAIFEKQISNGAFTEDFGDGVGEEGFGQEDFENFIFQDDRFGQDFWETLGEEDEEEEK